MFSKKCNQPNIDNTIFYTSYFNDPMKKEFETIIEMVKDAAKYEKSNEIDVSICMLNNIREYIGKYVSSINER